MSAFSEKKRKQLKPRSRKKRRQKSTNQAAAATKKIMQYSAFYVNEIAGWHTNVSVNGCKAFLSLQGNPLGWHGLIQ